MSDRSPGEIWAEIVRTAQVVRAYTHPEGLEQRLVERQALTDADTRYVVGTVSDAQILAGLVNDLATRTGPLREVHYDPDLMRITEIPEIDRALQHADPVPGLVEYFSTRWDEDGRDAVIRDLELSVNALPVNSSAHKGMSAWLADAREGTRPAGW